MSVVHNIFFFIVAIGLLVTFHEFGHFWVARRLGVRVLRFSVGFGKPLLSWKRGRPGYEVEYMIAAIPLGGYVKMLDEREGDVRAEDRPFAFNRQPVLTRTAIVAAGPAFNFILAVALYWVMFVTGTIERAPLMDAPNADSIAEVAGFQERDRVLSVNDREVRSWNGFRIALIDEGLDGGGIDIRVRGDSGAERMRRLELGDMRVLEDQGDILDKLGFAHWSPDMPPEIGGLIEDEPARQAGLEPGDLVLAIDDRSVSDWSEIVDIVRDNPGASLRFTILRDGAQRTLPVTPGTKKRGNEKIGYIGAYQVLPESMRHELQVEIRYGWLEALPRAVVKTWDMSLLTLRVLWKMITGEASLTNISGPITIAQYAGVSAAIGFTTYISFLAIISVSLGVLNLLPIPMLDGGHLLFYLIEVIKRGPVSESMQLRGQQVGIMLLALLMMIAIFNDFQRLLQ